MIGQALVSVEAALTVVSVGLQADCLFAPAGPPRSQTEHGYCVHALLESLVLYHPGPHLGWIVDRWTE
jgi:hypothetical protein